MYCPHCGAHIAETNQFCHTCGKELAKKSAIGESKFSKSTVESQRSNEFSEAPKPFIEFLKQRDKSKGKKKLVKKNKIETMIHVSMMRLINNTLRQVSGSRTPVCVNVNANYDEVKKAAYDKLKRYVPEMEQYSNSDLQLCFRSGEMAVCLPGTITEFTLSGYKDDLGVKYSQLLLYLRPYEREDTNDFDSDSDFVPKDTRFDILL